jgi:hypothetical protein
VTGTLYLDPGAPGEIYECSEAGSNPITCSPPASVAHERTVELCPDSSLAPTVYESADPSWIVDPLNAVGTALASPYEHAPGAGTELFYQVDDGSGLPAEIRIVKDELKLMIYF